MSDENGLTTQRSTIDSDLPPKGDLSDFIGNHAGADVAALVNEAVNATAVIDPQAADPADEVEREYGEPYSTSKAGNYSLNQAFWAGLYRQENIVLQEPAEDEFYRYDAASGLYTPISKARIKTDIGARIHKAAVEWGQPGLSRCRGDRLLGEVVGHVKGQAEIRDAFSKKDRRHVHLANGVLVLRDDGEADLVEFSPEFLSRNRSPVAFDATAQCPRFLDELVHPAVHAEDVGLLRKFAGMFLLAANLVQRLLLLDGTAGGGKGAFCKTIQRLVGMANCTELRTSLLGGRFELYRYIKKTLLYGPDVPADFLDTPGASRIKSLVGGDLLDPEGKNLRGSFVMEGHFNIILTSNSRLRVKLEGDAEAWRRRLTIVRYENQPPKKRIPDFDKVLIETEGSGVLNWALSGLQDLLRDIQETGDIVLTVRQLGAVDALLAESDSLRIFLRESVAITAGSHVSTADITEAYARYCPARGWNPLPITVIHRQMPGLMLELFQTVQSHSCGAGGNARGYRNVRIKNQGAAS